MRMKTESPFIRQAFRVRTGFRSNCGGRTGRALLGLVRARL